MPQRPQMTNVVEGSEFTSLLGPQNAMKEAECIRFREHEGQGGGLTRLSCICRITTVKGLEVPSVTHWVRHRWGWKAPHRGVANGESCLEGAFVAFCCAA